MIAGIGLDVVHVSRLERWRKTPGLLERYFHPEELAAALSRGSTAMLSLAARFAAKGDRHGPPRDNPQEYPGSQQP